MKKLLNACLLLTSFIGYLQWGKGQHAFLFQVEYDLLFKAAHAQNFLHPFVLVPMCGQLLLLITLFQKTPRRTLSIGGLLCLSIIMLFIFLIGVMTRNAGILLSSLPFILTGLLMLVYNRRTKQKTTT